MNFNATTHTRKDTLAKTHSHNLHIFDSKCYYKGDFIENFFRHKIDLKIISSSTILCDKLPSKHIVKISLTYCWENLRAQKFDRNNFLNFFFSFCNSKRVNDMIFISVVFNCSITDWNGKIHVVWFLHRHFMEWWDITVK